MTIEESKMMWKLEVENNKPPGGDREVLADNTELSNKTRLCESECTDGTC